MLEQSFRNEQVPQNLSENEQEMREFQAWVEKFATPLYTEIERTEKPLSITSPLFIQLKESLSAPFPNGVVPEIYSLLIQRVSFILRSQRTAHHQLNDLEDLLHKEKLFHSPQGVEEFLRQQPH